MLKSKSQVTCSFCSKIFKNPIVLPCDDSICLEHLKDRDIVKAYRIKCKKCNEEFGDKNNQMKSNEALTQIIESQSHLNDEEISLKQQLEVSIKIFFEYYDEFAQNKAKLESDVFDHFQEMRFKVDEQREELKKRIDDIALEMIDKIKINEAMYLKELKERFSSFDQSKSLEIELNQIEETFRHPKMLIETIREMQHKQDESLDEIKLRLNEMNQVKYDLEATLFFKPNLSSFDQTETSLFGSIKLSQFTNMNLFKSQILTNAQEYFELIKVCEFSPNDKWSLLYRGTRDGFGSHVFHSKCDGHSNTLTIFKAAESSYIFGGFTTVRWTSYGECESDPKAFIFSLTNKDNKPLKMKIHSNDYDEAIYCGSSFGPLFGGDIDLVNNANTRKDSVSYLGHTYSHPQYAYETIEAETFLAGSHYFQLDEIEVFQKE
jgi:hypothetical protein